MTISESIQLAVKNGFKDTRPDNAILWEYSIFLDPLFWQALGKGMGWKTGYYEYGSANEAIEMSPWQAEWHRFIDHLASGNSIDSFFASLK